MKSRLLSLAVRPLASRLLTFEGCDFAQPAGEPAIVPPDSVSWRVFSNPLTLYIGGVAAVVLEFGDARVRAGVWDYSSFRDDPGERMRRTGAAAMMTVYAARSRFEALAARVNRIHAQIVGVTPEGEAYRADDPELLLWVQATASYAFLTAYRRYSQPLSQQERDLFYGEARNGAPLYGVEGAPGSEAELEALFEAAKPRLNGSPQIADFLDIMRSAPILPLPMRPLQKLVVDAAVDLIEPDLRERLGLGTSNRLSGAGRRLVRMLARIAETLDLPSSPWAQASRRLGLPSDYLARSGQAPVDRFPRRP